MANNIIALANEVAGLLSLGINFRAATAQVLRSHGITENWNIYYTEIGRELGKRKKKKKKKAKKEALEQKPTPRQLYLDFKPIIINHLPK